MLREVARPAAPILMLPLVAGAMVGGCAGQEEPVANAVTAQPAAPAAAPSPTEVAEQLVRRDVGGNAIRFADTQAYDSQGATVVCGRFARDGQADQRYIVVGSEDLFIESRMAPGEMDRAAQEFCRNA